MKLRLSIYSMCFFLFLAACKQTAHNSIIKQGFAQPVEEKQVFPEQKVGDELVSGQNSLAKEEISVNLPVPIDTIITYYNDTSYLNVYIFSKYDSLEGQPIKSFEVRDNKNNLILINKGDSLFLEDFGPDEEHVTIYPLFRVINYDTLQIEVSFTFYPELSCAYTSEITSRLNIQRPYSVAEHPFIKYDFFLTNSLFNYSKTFLINSSHSILRDIESVYVDFQNLSKNNFLPVVDKDNLYDDIYYIGIKGDTNNINEMINEYNNKWDPGDIHYQLTKFLLSF